MLITLRAILPVLLLIFADLFAPAQAQTQADLLPVDEAFVLKVNGRSNEITLNFKIAEGYYLYKEKIKISSDASKALGKAIFPIARIQEDEFFGRVGIYRNKVKVIIPVLVNQIKTLNLSVSYQGCADIGVCYPPVQKNMLIELVDGSDLADDFSARGVIKSAGDAISEAGQRSKNIFNRFIGGGDPEPLPPDKAFIFSINTQDEKTLIATWRIRSDYYLYRDKISFNVKGADVSHVALPEGEIKDDPYFGKVETYKGVLKAEILLANIVNRDIEISAKYQGCWEGGVCYPPQEKHVNLTLPASTKNTASKSVEAFVNVSALDVDKTTYKSEDVGIVNILKSDKLWWVLASFFGFGLLLSFTPCVFPMIPILSGIIVGQGTHISLTRAFFMSLVFVLTMSFTYALAGVITGYSGENLQIWFQNPWVITSFSAVFVVLALSMFGYFDIQLPAFLQKKARDLSNQQKSSLWGVAVMGFLSALIVGPCVAPPLAGALIYIGQTGDAVLGGLALFSMSIGMGIPLLLIGTTAGKILPKMGTWMDKIKAVFGILMLGIAIYLLDRIVSDLVSLILWASLITISMGAMGALKPLTKDATPWQGIFKTIGLMIFAYGILLWLLVARGGGDMLAPLSIWQMYSQNTSQAKQLNFEKVTNNLELDNILVRAQKDNQVVMLDFYADWCVSCKIWERNVFTNASVIDKLSGVIALKADVTENNRDDKALMKRFNIIGPPGILFFKNGAELRHLRIIGEMNAKNFLTHFEKIY